MADRVLILGASARAAAASARRAGLEPFAIDLFADADTKRICDCVKCPPEEYPQGLFRLARLAPPMPWMYTGGLENYPELVGELAAERELLGNRSEVLWRVRDPDELSRSVCLIQGEVTRFMYPGERRPPHVTGPWLRKPLAGSGGRGIRFATDDDFKRPRGTPGYYLQEFIPGRPMSALFGPRRLGLCRQLVGEPWLHASPFAYCGNIVVVPTAKLDASLSTLADWLAMDFKLTDLWGIDFIESADKAWVVELNPRYTASVEAIEFATSVPVLRRVGFEDSAHPTKSVGKAIYYAPHRIAFPASGPWDDSLAHAADVWRRPDFADIPHAGDIIEPGHPVLTVLTEGATEAECLARLQSRAAELDRLFGASP